MLVAILSRQTLALFLQKIQSMYGQARRVWIMDRGIPTQATLKQMRGLSSAAPGLTPRAALASLSSIQMLEVQIPTTNGRLRVMPRYTEPQAQQKMILEALKLTLPPQRIRAGKIPLPDARPDAVL